MKDTSSRSIVSEAVICVAICAGGYMGLVDPIHRERASYEAFQQDPLTYRADALMRGGSVEAAIRAVEEAEARAGMIASKGEAARDELLAFEQLMQSATDASLTVEELERRDAAGQPETTRPHVGAAAPPIPGAIPSPAPAHKDVSVAFMMKVRGEYAQLVNLVASLSADPERHAITSIAIDPAGNTADPLVTATIETVHYGFDASLPLSKARVAWAALRALDGHTHDDHEVCP